MRKTERKGAATAPTRYVSRFVHLSAQRRDFAAAELRHGLGGILTTRYVAPRPRSCPRTSSPYVRLERGKETRPSPAVSSSVVSTDSTATRAVLDAARLPECRPSTPAYSVPRPASLTSSLPSALRTLSSSVRS